jgi:hypothetical protein
LTLRPASESAAIQALATCRDPVRCVSPARGLDGESPVAGVV